MSRPGWGENHNALKYIPPLLEFTFQPFSSISFHFEPSERHIPVLNRMIYGITPILETSLIYELSKLVKNIFWHCNQHLKYFPDFFLSKWINKTKCHISSRGAPVTGRSCAFSRSIAAPSLLQGPRLIMMLMRISWTGSRMGGFLGKHDFGRKIHAQSWAWIGAAAQFLNWNQSLIIFQSSARIPGAGMENFNILSTFPPACPDLTIVISHGHSWGRLWGQSWGQSRSWSWDRYLGQPYETNYRVALGGNFLRNQRNNNFMLRCLIIKNSNWACQKMIYHP